MIEITFAILASRFRIFRRPIIGKIENIKHITKAAVIFHNFLMKRKERGTDCPPDYVDQETVQGTLPGGWRVEANGVQGLNQIISLELRRKCAMILKISLTHHKEK